MFKVRNENTKKISLVIMIILCMQILIPIFSNLEFASVIDKSKPQINYVTGNPSEKGYNQKM